MMQQRSIFRISFGSLLAFSLFGALTVQAQSRESARELNSIIKIMKAEIAEDKKIMATTNPQNSSYLQANIRLKMNLANLHGAQKAFDAARNAEKLEWGRSMSTPARVGGGGGSAVSSQYEDWRDFSPRNVLPRDTNHSSTLTAAGEVSSKEGGKWGGLPAQEVSTLFKRLKTQASSLDATLLDNIFPGNFKVSEELTLRTESAKRQYLMQQLEKLADIAANENEAKRLENLNSFIAKHGWFGRYVQSFAARGEMFDANMAKQTIASGEGLEKVKKMAVSRHILSAALARHVNGVTPYLSSKSKEGVVAILLGAVLSATAQAGEAESVLPEDSQASGSLAADDRAAFRPAARLRRGGVSN